MILWTFLQIYVNFRYVLEDSTGAKFLLHKAKSIFRRRVEEFPATKKILNSLQWKFEGLYVSYSKVSGWFWIIHSLKVTGNFAPKIFLHFKKYYDKSNSIFKFCGSVYFVKLRLWCHTCFLLILLTEYIQRCLFKLLVLEACAEIWKSTSFLWLSHY